MYETILVSKAEGVGKVTLNRPDVFNALSLKMREELASAFESFGNDDEVKVILLTGAGKAFCAGGDVKEQGAGFDAISGRERVRRLHRTLLLMVNSDKPIISAVNGIAVGAGFSLALAGDIIICAEEARFSQIFINIGFVPDFGSAYFLPRLIGMARAKDLVLTGRMVGAKEAKEIGLVSQVVPLSELESTAMNLAKTLASRSAKALAFDKMMLNRSLDSDLNTMLEIEAFAQGICFQSDEHKQALQELLNKKK